MLGDVLSLLGTFDDSLVCFWCSVLRLDGILALDSADTTDRISDFLGSIFCRILGVVSFRRYFAGLILGLGGLIGFGLLVGLCFCGYLLGDVLSLFGTHAADRLGLRL